MRPFEMIAAAEVASRDNDLAKAETLFKNGIQAYTRYEPDGVDYALGRYGAFLIEQGRSDDALDVLKLAIDQNTDIPRIRADYLGVLSDRRDLKAIQSYAERKNASGAFAIEFLLSHARRADREGATEFAEQLARWIIDRCSRDSDAKGRWTAIGDLGRILERKGDLDQAVKLWHNAFEEGSCDAETINRLSMHLERSKDYTRAVSVIREGLTRGLPANVEESLRKRLARCAESSTGRGRVKAKTRVDIPAYSIRGDANAFDFLFQVRPRHSLSAIAVTNNTVRCLSSTSESSTLIDFDVENGSEIRKIENLPLLTTFCIAPTGQIVGICRTAPVGRGPTLLKFLDPEGHVTAESSVPDATSEIAIGPNVLYVGCRDGFLYGFGLDGKRRWAWETPGTRGYNENAYFRPCPYFVSANGAFAAVSSMGNLYAVSPDGTTLWDAVLPNESQTHWNFTVPFPGTNAIREPYSVLELQRGAGREEVKSAYRRLALATHPDRNPDDNQAAARFCRVREAYERILAGEIDRQAAGITVSIEIRGPGPVVSSIAARNTDVIVASSTGRLYVFGMDGRLREARILGDSSARVAFRKDGSLGAAWCGNSLLWFHRNEIVATSEYEDWPHGLIMLGNEVVLWRGNEAHVVAPEKTLLSLEFSKSIHNVVSCGDVLLCVGGVLAAFKRKRST
ncbi:MAG TPA: J domain-containing protein [Terriglobales bacterium]|nr:J domain-containing protein [Terriglobales bacterium]